MKIINTHTESSPEYMEHALQVAAAWMLSGVPAHRICPRLDARANQVVRKLENAAFANARARYLGRIPILEAAA